MLACSSHEKLSTDTSRVTYTDIHADTHIYPHTHSYMFIHTYTLTQTWVNSMEGGPDRCFHQEFVYVQHKMD